MAELHNGVGLKISAGVGHKIFILEEGFYYGRLGGNFARERVMELLFNSHLKNIYIRRGRFWEFYSSF